MVGEVGRETRRSIDRRVGPFRCTAHQFPRSMIGGTYRSARVVGITGYRSGPCVIRGPLTKILSRSRESAKLLDAPDAGHFDLSRSPINLASQ